MLNSIKNIDEFEYFKKKMILMKEKYPELLQEVVKMLPQAKRDYLSNVMSFQRVMNEPRKILKIKRN